MHNFGKEISDFIIQLSKEIHDSHNGTIRIPQKTYCCPVGKTYYCSKGNHIFINHDFTDLAVDIICDNFRNNKLGVTIKRNHRVHIFLDRFNASINNEGLLIFVNRCIECTTKKVIIHIPNNKPLLVKGIKSLLGSLPN